MPRPRQFDIDDALMKAMAVFWAHGYKATSMQDLVDAMGIERGSIYGAFGSKRALFLKALTHYDQVYREAWFEERASSSSPRQAVLDVFEAAVSVTVEDGSRDGCLLVNTALELSPHDDEIAAIVDHAFTEAEAFFRTMIERGQAAGEISTEVNAVSTARALLGLFLGLRVLSRSRPEETVLRSIADQAEALLYR